MAVDRFTFEQKALLLEMLNNKRITADVQKYMYEKHHITTSVVQDSITVDIPDTMTSTEASILIMELAALYR